MIDASGLFRIQRMGEFLASAAAALLLARFAAIAMPMRGVGRRDTLDGVVLIAAWAVMTVALFALMLMVPSISPVIVLALFVAGGLLIIRP